MSDGVVRRMRTSLRQNSDAVPFAVQRPRHSARAVARFRLKMCRLERLRSCGTAAGTPRGIVWISKSDLVMGPVRRTSSGSVDKCIADKGRTNDRNLRRSTLRKKSLAKREPSTNDSAITASHTPRYLCAMSGSCDSSCEVPDHTTVPFSRI